MPETYSLYFHVPFCTHRCAYCDFNTYAGQGEHIQAYVDALCNEIRAVGRSDSQIAPSVHTLFFGGGTPSLLTCDQFQNIFKNVRQYFNVLRDAEISLEANPGTTSFDYLKKLRLAGFNRISFGVQSANPDELRMLERIHDFFDVIDAVKWARQAGFDNLNLDLIYGLPGQTLEKWKNTVKRAVDLRPEHISAYALTLEHGTPFGRWAGKGLLPIPDPDLAADMYEWVMDFLGGLGYEQYEISNWSLFGRECRHNLQYWRNLNYLGLGAGAHGFVDSMRYSNVLRIKTYIDRLTSGFQPASFPLSPAMVNQHKNNSFEDMQETMMTGLRLTREGISATVFHERFGVDLMDVFGKEIYELVRLGLLEWVDFSQPHIGKGLRLTYRGRLLGNQVFMHFV
jgi:oxygen-independent coproporphyrinogen-3 oxidase